MSSRRTLLSNTPAGSSSSRSRVGGSHAHHRSQQHATSSSSQRHASTSLPKYEPPSCALDAEARRALADLGGANAADTRAYAAQLATSLKLLGESVAELNERDAERRARLASRREKLQERGGEAGGNLAKTEDDEDDGEDGEGGGGGGGARKRQKRTEADAALEAAVERLDAYVPGASRRCDEAVREVIDWGVELADGRAALAEAADAAEAESARVAQLLQKRQAEAEAMAAAGRGRRRRGDEDGDDEDEDDEADDDVKHPSLLGDDIKVTGPLRQLAASRDQLAADYAAKTLHARYGLSNDYVAFKRLWHEGAHGRDGQPLPDASRWFAAAADGDEHPGGRSAGRRGRGRRDEDDDDDEEEEDDEDLVVAGEIRDIHCPLSRAVMHNPYTSHVCRHTFEKAAIVEFLRSQPGRKARCPQTGCDKVSGGGASNQRLCPRGAGSQSAHRLTTQP